ncbi:MAG: NAD(P)-binding protein [Desulfobacteraceae bacterium]|nr:NAD(P)-binding protein [Desulfobacteraceae bacterium]
MSENTRSDIRIGVFLCHCGQNIAGVLNIKNLADFSAGLSGVVKVSDNLYTCSEPGQQEIIKDIRENEIDRVVIAACSPKLHEETFRNCVAEADLNPFLMEMVNVREHLSWVHSQTPEEAQTKAEDMLAAAVARVHLLEPLEYIQVPVTRRAVVVGGGIAGLEAALDLADAQVETVLVEKGPSLGGRMAQLCKTFPTMDCPV